MLKSFELLIGGIPGQNTSYGLNIDLCHEAVLVSVETKPNDVLEDALDMTFNFSIPEEARERWNKGRRGFEVWSVPELDSDHYPEYVQVAAVDERLFVFENRNFERENEVEMAALDEYYVLLDKVGNAGPFAPSGRSQIISFEQTVCLHLKDDPFKTIVYIEVVNHPQSGHPSLNIKFEHAALPNECGTGLITELDELVGRLGEIMYVPDVTNRPFCRIEQIDAKKCIVKIELDDNTVSIID